MVPGLLLGVGHDAVQGLELIDGILVVGNSVMLISETKKNHRLLRTETVNVSSDPPSHLEGATQYASLLSHVRRILSSSIAILAQFHLCLLSG